MAFGGGKVVVEPSAQEPFWNITKNGFPQERVRGKSRAVKKARKIARREGLSLEVLNRDMSVSESVSR